MPDVLAERTTAEIPHATADACGLADSMGMAMPDVLAERTTAEISHAMADGCGLAGSRGMAMPVPAKIVVESEGDMTDSTLVEIPVAADEGTVTCESPESATSTSQLKNDNEAALHLTKLSAGGS